MKKVVVLGTGGTIASRADSSGSDVATDSISTLLDSVYGRVDRSIQIDGVDLSTVGSYLLTPSDQLEIVRRIRDSLEDPSVAGVVVTHGTDTMEETAYLCQLHQPDQRPVVFTGAQYTAEHPLSDGPRNLADAITVAAAEHAPGIGTVVVFDGHVFTAAGTRKSHTTDVDAFDNGASGSLGTVAEGVVTFTARPAVMSGFVIPDTAPRVDIVAVYPGADRVLFDAAVGAGARGIVLETTGIGNGNNHMVEAAQEFIARGGVVVFASRVADGAVIPRYGNGGGADLDRIGAVPAGFLRPSQARVLLASALAAHRNPQQVVDAVRLRTSPATHPVLGHTRPQK